MIWNLVQRVIAAFILMPALTVAWGVGLLIRTGSSGPIFVRLTREGRYGVPFAMLKLRTMVPDADAVLRDYLTTDDSSRREWNEFGRLVHDPRVAGPIARFARRYSIDELPQFLNVVCGDMNLVGPRPLPLDVVATMKAENRKSRQAVLPGITGEWQVSGRSDLSIEEMGRLDSRYVRRRTPLLDLAIIFRTVRAVVSGKGAY